MVFLRASAKKIAIFNHIIAENYWSFRYKNYGAIRPLFGHNQQMQYCEIH